MNVTTQPRKPAGTPAGGEFAGKTGSMPSSALAPTDIWAHRLEVSYDPTPADAAVWAAGVAAAEGELARFVADNPVAEPAPDPAKFGLPSPWLHDYVLAERQAERSARTAWVSARVGNHPATQSLKFELDAATEKVAAAEAAAKECMAPFLAERALWDQRTGGPYTRAQPWAEALIAQAEAKHARVAAMKALSSTAPAGGEFVPVSELSKVGTVCCFDGGWNVWLPSGERMTGISPAGHGQVAGVGIVGDRGGTAVEQVHHANFTSTTRCPEVYVVPALGDKFWPALRAAEVDSSG